VRNIPRKFLLLAIAVIGVLAIGIPSALAATSSIPDPSGVIHACYKTAVAAHGSPLKVIDSNAGGSCAAGYSPLTWDQVGPTGPTGPAGATGATGGTGPAGPSGISNYQLVQQTEHVGCYGEYTLPIPAGDQVLGAGVDSPSSFSPFIQSANGPDPSDSTQWEFQVGYAIQSGGCSGGTVNLWMTVATVSS